MIYSTSSVFQMIEDFYSQLKVYWGEYLVEEFDNKEEKYLELFFAKNEVMNQHHEQYGFSLDSNGEGCFMFIGKKLSVTDLDIFIKEQIHVPREVLTESYNSKLIAKDLWEITLVLPSAVEESVFCEFIMDSVLISLRRLVY